ncbi:class I SAM-dependent methyltransferase [Octadecabacter ascidiaceicola]|uniref:Putative methyltransferase YcgJ n=1 Tax=Octadecabacter ascidiaceicola TaxID=1655543 RepID=A0A238KKG5_9RHOB|nr:class I SAM-dependent methyltransferase [Octadecabacter ascidiaceicola]SMX43251.1 putative methyltransferase YcgJ [Octadecabacter ascidiaceicola]
MKDAATFWDKVAPKYAQDPIKDMAAYEYTLERTKSYLGADDRVLEMGCGTGSTALLIAPHVREIVGTDVSPAMIEIATTKANAEGIKNAKFQVSTARGATSAPEAFDAVLGFNLFHLVNGAEDVFAEVYRSLPKGGYFISKTPCLGDKSIGLKRFLFKAMIPPMQWFGKAPYVRFFTHREYEDALRFAGFDIVETGNFPAISRYVVARKT